MTQTPATNARLLTLLGNCANKLESLGRTFSSPNFTDRYADGPHCLGLARDVKTLLEELRALPSETATHGWRLVPVSPTQEMLWAMCENADLCKKCPAIVETIYGPGTAGCRVISEETWRDALNAAPQAGGGTVPTAPCSAPAVAAPDAAPSARGRTGLEQRYEEALRYIGKNATAGKDWRFAQFILEGMSVEEAVEAARNLYGR